MTSPTDRAIEVLEEALALIQRECVFPIKVTEISEGNRWSISIEMERSTDETRRIASKIQEQETTTSVNLICCPHCGSAKCEDVTSNCSSSSLEMLCLECDAVFNQEVQR